MPPLGIIEDIQINRIHPSPYNLRTIPQRIDELLLSIDRVGLLQPIIIRPLEEGFEIVAGNRRLDACRRLGWRKIPCHIVELNDREAFEVSLIENIQRRTLNPIEEAEAFRRYVDGYGWGGVSEIAERIGKSQEYVSKRMRLLNLPRKIRDELSVGRITPSVAEELLSLEEDELRLELGSIASSHRLTLREVRSLTRMLKETDRVAFDNGTAPTLPTDDRSRLSADRALRRAIVILRTTLIRLDDLVKDFDDQWIIHELLIEYRLHLHDQISSFIKARRRLDRLFYGRPVKVVEAV